MNIKKKSLQDVSMYMRLLHQEMKLPIGAIRKRNLETKSCPNSSFLNKLCYWNLNKKETFL